MEKEQLESLKKIAKMWILPTLLYFLVFCLLTYPLILRFNTHFFTQTGDGDTNIWNLWWTNKAITELHQSPWYTTYLYYPQGTTLLGHTLNPFNGFLGIFLLKFLSLIQTHNAIVLFTFVVGGLTTFRLSHFLTKSYWSSLIAGYIFTFSQYHFMHAQGHMNLISLELIPLFLLCWYKLIDAPSIGKAIISGIVLFGVLLCDNYYFLYCVLAGGLIALWYAISSKDYLYFIKKKYLIAFSVFICICLLTSGVLVFSLLKTTITDPFLGEHDPESFSLDLLAPFIPGGHWRFAELTEFYWSKLPGNIHESSVYLGLSVVFLVIYAAIQQKKARKIVPSLSLWYIILFFFGLMALGPVLQIAGKHIYSGIMPYTILVKLFPPLEMAGCVVRMMVMVNLMAGVISAISLQMLFEQLDFQRVLLGSLLAVLLVIEFLPTPLPLLDPAVPGYVTVLAGLEGEGGVADTVSPYHSTVYHQTIHEKPLMDGYISRRSTSVLRELGWKLRCAEEENYFTLLEEYDIHYLITHAEILTVPNGMTMTLLYDEQNVRMYQMERTPLIPEEIDLDALTLNADPQGYIDIYDSKKIYGWALIPEADTQNSEISILLSDEKHSWKLATQRIKRPDVSEHFETGSLYDHSGYVAHLGAYEIPASSYKIAILIENAEQKTVIWTDLIFDSPNQP